MANDIKWKTFIDYMRILVMKEMDNIVYEPWEYQEKNGKGYHYGDIPDFLEIVRWAHEKKAKKILKKIQTKMDTAPADEVWQCLHDAGLMDDGRLVV